MKNRAALALLFTACTLQLASSENPLTLQGKVTSNGAPLAGATVKAGEASTTTSTSGEYRLQVMTQQPRVVLEISAKGYAPTRAVVTHRAGVYQYNATIE